MGFSVSPCSRLWLTDRNKAPPPAIITPTAQPFASTSDVGQLPPPPKMQILKRRPQGSKPSSRPASGGTSDSQTRSIEQREEDYRKARERIFGATEDSSSRENSASGRQRSGVSSPANQSWTSTPSYQTSSPGLGEEQHRIIPTQIRRSPAATRSSTPDGRIDGRQSGRGRGSGGLLRQPRGPGAGNGFGQR